MSTVDGGQEAFTAAPLTRMDKTGAARQTSSGRIEVKVTRNFSILLDKDVCRSVQRPCETDQTVEQPQPR